MLAYSPHPKNERKNHIGKITIWRIFLHWTNQTHKMQKKPKCKTVTAFYIFTHVAELNWQIQNGAIKSNHFSCGGAVISHHAKPHAHRFHIWTESTDIKTSISPTSRQWYCSPHLAFDRWIEPQHLLECYMILIDSLILAADRNVVGANSYGGSFDPSFIKGLTKKKREHQRWKMRVYCKQWYKKVRSAVTIFKIFSS